jgi:hypothetical protein
LEPQWICRPSAQDPFVLGIDATVKLLFTTSSQAAFLLLLRKISRQDHRAIPFSSSAARISRKISEIAV